jgi:hypothetical protein
MKQIHHIIPKHMGGTDDPSNLIELTIEEHAEAHRILYEQHGKVEDKRAWLGLAKMMSKEEIIYEIISQPKSEEWKEKNRKPKSNTEKYFGNTNAKGNAGKAKSTEHKKKISESHKGMKKDWLIGNKNGTVLKGRKKTQEHQQAINEMLNSPEVKEKIAASWANKPILKCPICGTEGKHNMNRYHFNNCKKAK